MSIILTLLVVGSLLLLAEIFLPGMIAGLLGGLCYLAAIAYGYQHYDDPTQHYIAFGIVGLGGIEFFAWMAWFPKSKVAQRFVSKSTIGDIGNEHTEWIGQKGIALSHLRPCGAVRLLNGTKVDVVTEGGMIDQDTRVKVVDVEGMRVVVRRDEED
jgi:membrane-bound serine protease (ClpP class)